ncbi:MAG: DUF2922 domain-containing protein [Solibacillus sp.]
MSTVTTRNVLSMDFTLDDGKTKSIRITDPKSSLTAAEVETAMNTLVDLRALKDFTYGPASLKGAKTVQTVTNKFDIVVN